MDQKPTWRLRILAKEATSVLVFRENAYYTATDLSSDLNLKNLNTLNPKTAEKEPQPPPSKKRKPGISKSGSGFWDPRKVALRMGL